jgi:hypothetical protein
MVQQTQTFITARLKNMTKNLTSLKTDNQRDSLCDLFLVTDYSL